MRGGVGCRQPVGAERDPARRERAPVEPQREQAGAVAGEDGHQHAAAGRGRGDAPRPVRARDDEVPVAALRRPPAPREAAVRPRGREGVGRPVLGDHADAAVPRGEADVARVDPRVHKIMDLKAPGSGEAHRNRWSNLAHLGPRDEACRVGDAFNARTRALHDLLHAAIRGSAA